MKLRTERIFSYAQDDEIRAEVTKGSEGQIRDFFATRQDQADEANISLRSQDLHGTIGGHASY